MRLPHIALCSVLLSITIASPAWTRDKRPKPASQPPQDAITVVGHLASTGGPVTGFLFTEHYSSHYLYVEHESGKNVTLIDVTKANQPTVLADVPYPSDEGRSSELFVAVGTVALVMEGEPMKPGLRSQTVRIINFSTPEHPQVAREFMGVTAMSRDDHRGLIFIANPDGIWILHQELALDPEVEKAYSNYVLYSH